MLQLSALIDTLTTSNETAFVTGVLAAFTPCVVALIPVFLYRFGFLGAKTEARTWTSLLRELLLFLTGFFLSFAVTGWVFQNLFNSEFVSAVRLVIGSLLIIGGILLFAGKLSLQFVQNVSNPFILGFALPWVISFSPCVIPFLDGLLVNVASIDAGIILKFLLFGLGLLTPAVLIAIVGNRLYRLLQKGGKVFHWLDKIAPALLIISGLYIASQLVQITTRDITIAGYALLLLIVLLLRQIFKSSERFTVQNILWVVVVTIAFVVLLFYAGNLAEPYQQALKGQEFIAACEPGSHQNSPVALNIAVAFAAYSALLASFYIRSGKPGKRIKFTA